MALFRSLSGERLASGHPKVLAAEELLRATYRQPWSLRGVADAVGLHPAHLGRSFRARFGCTTSQKIAFVR